MNTDISSRQLEIIRAAGQILTNAGVSGLTIKNLAKAMDFSESAIYRHFASKEDIIVALLEYLAKSLEERYQTLADEPLDVKTRFEKMFNHQFSFFKDNPYFAVAVFSDGLLEESARINTCISQIMKVKVKYLRPIIEAGQKDSIFTVAISVDAVMHIVMGAVRLQMFKWRLANFNFDIVVEGAVLIDSLVLLLKKNSILEIKATNYEN